MKKVLRWFPWLVLSAACGGQSGEGGSDEATGFSGVDAGANGTTSTASTGGGAAGFALLAASSAHANAIASLGSSGMVTTPEGTFSLGYVPAPVEIPQTMPAYNTVADYPPTFDLRTQGKLTAIRDQGACGACWTFATFASTESDLLPGETDDFSEDHLNNAHGFDIPACNGGNHLMSIAYMSRWSGPAYESDAPYTAKAHAYTTQPTVRKHLMEAFILPDRTGPLDNDVIKGAVATYGAMYTTVNWATPNYDASTFAYYHPGPISSSNHAVAIVGWDDNYAASNFAKSPPGNGAFLVRNSWGTSFGDAGYFHISYYDVFVGKGNAVFESFDSPTDYAAVYQYDKYGETSALTYPASTTYAANVFTSTAESGLQAVSFYTAQPASTVTISVYDAPTSSPTTGTLLGTTQAAEPYAGYHTVVVSALGAKVHVGRKFSVVVQVATTGATSYLPVEAPFPGYSSKVVATAGTGFISADGNAWTDTAKTWKANVPIKAFIAKSPNCDDGNACTVDGWDGTECTHTAASAGTVCRAVVGTCDVAEVCDGSGAACPADSLVQAGTQCRAANGACDAAEVCTGASGACPPDGFQPAITVCRPAAGVCDAPEHCTGTSAACPADTKDKAGTVCRPSASACDATETCSGSSNDCPADKASVKGTVCRAKSGDCDVADTCDGTNMTCPNDAVATKGTVCRVSAGVCDVAETCDGATAACPTNAFASSSTVCRASAGACDIAETCSGSSAACPANAFEPKGYVCSQNPTKTCKGGVATCN